MSKNKGYAKTGLTGNKCLVLQETQKRKWKKKEAKGIFWELPLGGNESRVQEILQLYKT